MTRTLTAPRSIIRQRQDIELNTGDNEMILTRSALAVHAPVTKTAKPPTVFHSSRSKRNQATETNIKLLLLEFLKARSLGAASTLSG